MRQSGGRPLSNTKFPSQVPATLTVNFHRSSSFGLLLWWCQFYCFESIIMRPYRALCAVPLLLPTFCAARPEPRPEAIADPEAIAEAEAQTLTNNAPFSGAVYIVDPNGQAVTAQNSNMCPAYASSSCGDIGQTSWWVVISHVVLDGLTIPGVALAAIHALYQQTPTAWLAAVLLGALAVEA
jgi:hypothetical protein